MNTGSGDGARRPLVAEEERGFGVLLRLARLRGGLTQEELASRSGLSTRTISDLERGRVARPRGSSLDLLIAALPAEEATVAALVRAARTGGEAEPVYPRDAGMPAATEAEVCELPAAVGDFTGRERELSLLAARAAAALADGSPAPVVLILSGPPGVGKTALAVRFGHLLAARYPIMQLLVELGGGTGSPLAPADALRQLLASLGVADRECPADQEQRVRRYRSLLYHRKALVLLDNAADEAQVRPLLPAGPGCVVVITSRNALGGLSPTCRLVLEVLSPAEARAFLGQVAGPDRLAAEPAAADQLLGLCGRLPLALRIVGNQLACLPGWSLAYLAAELQNEHRRLAMLSSGDLGVLPAFDLAYQQLSAGAMAIFRRMPLVPGSSFGTDVIDALSDPDGSTVPGAFDELVSASLIEAAAAPGRYQMHDLLRLYARDKLGQEAPSEARAVERRAVGWLLRRAAAAARKVAPQVEGASQGPTSHDAAFGDRVAALAWLDAELPAVLAAAARAEHVDAADDAFAAADVLSWYFDLRCHWHSWQRMCETLLPPARARGDPAVQASLLNGLGLALSEQRRFAEAVGLHDEAAGLARRGGDRYEEALALDFRAHALVGIGRYDDAVAGHEQALERFRAAGYKRGAAMAINHCGEALRRAGRFEDAVACSSQALALFAALGEAVGGAMARLNMGLALASLGRYEEAVSRYRQALATFEESQDRWGQAQALYGLGCAFLADADSAAAAPWLRRAAEAFRLIGDLAGERDVLRGLAAALSAVGEAAEARTQERRVSALGQTLDE